tara:strand:- start:93 stop:1247 length:1155 start_codon:yes stop_codon:yes gene_type:complete
MRNIPYGRQQITQEDIDEVVKTLKSEFITQGPKVKEFEEKFADFIGSKYAVAVSSGTAALHLSTIALGVNKKTKVICSPLTFVASSNSVIYSGGTIDFCDIDSKNLLMDIKLLEKKLESSPIGTYDGIIAVDFAGAAVKMDAFRRLSDKYNLWILEDSCHAPGAFFIDKENKKQMCGNGKYADLAIFSFHPVKHITCGEGGMITTNNKFLYQKILKLRSHGIVRDDFKNKIKNPGWYYEMQLLGYNYRLSDISCSLGISQLKRLDKNLLKRREIAEIYDSYFKAIDQISIPSFDYKISHAYHLYVIMINERDKLYNILREKGINVQLHYIPVHLQPYYKNLGFKKGHFPEVEKYYQKGLSLPIFPGLKKADQKFIIETILKFIK